MSLTLCRIDDRLVHGQVVVGWGRALHVRLLLLVDDGVRGNDWEQELYQMAVPPDVELQILSVAEAVAALPQWAADPRPTILVTGDIATMAALHAAHPELVARVNLGGLHHQDGRREHLPYVYLTDEEAAALRRLAAGGALVTAQDLPTSAPVDLAALLR